MLMKCIGSGSSGNGYALDNSLEEWKWIKNFKGIYQVSSFGRIKSFKKTEQGYILSNQNAKGDYLRVVLYDSSTGKRRSASIHVLVAEAFIGEIPPGYHVHHKDDNKQNNSVSNLEIIHPKKHRKETEKIHPQIISAMCNYNKYEKAKHIMQYDLDGNFIAEYANAQIASELSGVCRRNILQVANKEEYKNGKIRFQAGGYIWKAKEREVILCS